MVEHWILLTTLSCAFLGGLLLALLECLERPLAQRLAIEESKVRWLRFAFTVTLVPLMLVAGQIIDTAADAEILEASLRIGSLAAVAGLGLLGMARGFVTALSAATVIGAAVAFLLPASTLLMMRVMFEGHKPTHALCLGYIAVGLGVVVAKPLLEVLKVTVNFGRGLLVIALAAAALSAVTILAPPAEGLVKPTPFNPDLFFTSQLFTAGLVALLYMPLAGSLSTWASYYLSDLGHASSRIPLILACFWAGFLLTRFTTSWYLTSGYEGLVLFLMVLIVAVFFGNLAGAGPSSGAQGMFMVWACLGPVFPLLLAFLLPLAPGQGTAFAVLFGLGALGTLFFQPWLDRFGQNHTIRATMKIPMIVAFLLTAATLYLVLSVPTEARHWRERKKSKPPDAKAAAVFSVPTWGQSGSVSAPRTAQQV